jgi:hypothetical protein
MALGLFILVLQKLYLPEIGLPIFNKKKETNGKKSNKIAAKKKFSSSKAF